MLLQLNQNSNSEFSKSKIMDIDSLLIHEFQQNQNLTAFTELMNKYKKKVFNFCFRYMGNRDDADDVTQEIFIKVYEKAASFRGASKFSTWLFSITSNTCSNYFRKIKGKRRREASIYQNDNENDEQVIEIKDQNPDPEIQFLDKELGEVIRNAVAKLKKNQRSVIILKDFLGKSYEEISEILDLKIGTVKSTVSRGRLKVVKQIKDYNNQ